ncbi:MAG: L,D-transpeptidase family protein [Rhodospirillales bacterium]|nr:L,D-transpeptidase family protein [Rhodospirillales bacterium]
MAICALVSKNHRGLPLIAGLSAALLLGCMQIAGAAEIPSPVLQLAAAETDLPALPVREAPDLRTYIAAGKIDGRKLSDAQAIRAFYAARSNAPLWIGGNGPNRAAHDLVSVLDQAWTHGLNPAKYDLQAIDQMMKSGSEAQNRSALEIRLTDALVRYGRDITGTRAGRSEGATSIRRTPMDAGRILSLAENSSNLEKDLTDLAPRGALYRALQAELIRMVKEGTGADWKSLDFGHHPLYPGDSHPMVPLLRARFGTPVPENRQNFYDDSLAKAVATFQKDHKLQADAIVGPKTLAVLNQSPTARRNQILANMERLRWLDQERPNRYIIVNIPSQTLWAVAGEKVLHEMKVIVGKPVRGTKDFKATITGVRFNPTWTVPPTIKRKDFLPKLVNDPGYLSQKGITLLQKQGGKMVRVDPYEIDWASVNGSDLSQMSMVQGAGDRNALGKVRVLMPNPYDMYLHDTSSPELFAEEERTLSSGCVRIENPEAVADFILSGNEGWSSEKMKSLIDKGRTVDIKAEKQIPVYIIYQTAWLDSRGQLVFGQDVYGRDRDLIRALDSADDLPVFRAG